MNLYNVLKGHVGKTFYCTTVGEVTLEGIDETSIKIRALNIPDYSTLLTECGKACEYGEVILFPSEHLRDWSIWDKMNNTPRIWNGYLEGSFGVYTLNLCSDHICDPDKSISALFKIYTLIEKGYGKTLSYLEWKTGPSYGVFMTRNEKFEVIENPSVFTLLLFRTKEYAEKFISYPENIELLKDFFTI